METDVLLFEARFDAAEAQQKVVLFKQGLVELDKTRALLAKQLKEDKISSAEYAKGIDEIDRAAKSAKDGIRETNKAIADNKKVVDSAEGSLDQMAGNLSILRKEFRALPAEIRDNTQEGRALEKQIKDLSDEYVDLNKRIGDGRPNVGNYIRDLRIMGVSVGETEAALKKGGEGVQVFAKAIGTTRGALVALTAIPIVLFLTAIVAFFKSTDEGAEKLEQGLAGLGAGFNAVLKVIAPLGKLLVDSFTNPLGAIKKFGDALLHPIDSLKAIAFGSVEMAKEIGSSFVSAAEAAATYTRQLQVIEDDENDLIAQRSRVGLQVDQALLKVKDRNLSEKERINILREAGKAEAALAKQTEDLAKRRLAAQIQRNIEEKRRTGELSDESIRLSREAEAAAINAKRDSLNTQQTITNRESALREQSVSSAKEAANKQKEIAKNAAQDRVYLAELEIINAKLRGEERLDLEVDLLKKQGELQKVGLSKNAAQRKLIDAQTNAAILAANVAEAVRLEQQMSAIQRAQISSSLAVAMRGSRDASELQIREEQRQTKEQLTELEARLKLKKVTQEQYEEELADIQNSGGRRVSDIRTAFDQADANRKAEIAKLTIQTELDLSDEVVSIRRNQADRVITIEEQQQLAQVRLLEISAADREVREKAIRANAEKLRKANFQQILADERADKRSLIEAELTITAQGTKRELELRKAALRLQLADELANTEIGSKQKEEIRARYRKQEADLEAEHRQRILNLVLDSVEQSVGALNKIVEAQITRQTAALEDQQKIALSSAALTTEQRERIEIKFEKKKAALEKEAGERRRRFATIDNIINTARAVTSALATGFDPITKAIGVALAIATGAATQATIASQKFAKGTVLKGASHANGGIQLFSKSGHHFGEAEEDEIILTKGVYRDPVLRAKASALNVAGGGLPLTGTSNHSRPRFDYGGALYAQPTGAGAVIDYGELQRVFDNSIAKMPRQVLVVDDVQTGINRKVKVDNRASA